MSDQALVIWRDKLEFLEAQLAVASDSAQKFTLENQIKEAKAKIRELAGALAASAPVSPPRPAGDGGHTTRTPPAVSAADDQPLSPAVPWYKDYRFVVPIVVALITLVGTLAWRWQRGDEKPPATHSILVVVSDAATDAPVPRARVWADGHGNPQRTENLGCATLVVPGRIDSLRIRAEKEGYEPYEQDLQATRPFRRDPSHAERPGGLPDSVTAAFPAPFFPGLCCAAVVPGGGFRRGHESLDPWRPDHSR